MGFKLANIKGRAALLNEESFYDLEKISEGNLSHDTTDALFHLEELDELNNKLNDLELKVLNGKINFVLLKGIGNAFLSNKQNLKNLKKNTHIIN